MEITFIESWWEGGGNAGPCYEICVRGVELATLVFIKYRTTPQGLKDIPLKIVDTGYGLERFAWISQGTATAYEAAFGPVVDQLKKMAHVKVDEQILAENARVAGMMDIEDIADLKELRSKVAGKLDIPVEELIDATKPIESVYIIADHTRCLAFHAGRWSSTIQHQRWLSCQVNFKKNNQIYEGTTAGRVFRGHNENTTGLSKKELP